MTAIVGVVGKTGVFLAADTQASYDNLNRKMKNPKTVELSEVLAFAYSGYGRYAQAMEYGIVDLEDPALGRDEMDWAVREFIPYLDAVLEAAGCLHTDLETNVRGFGDFNSFLLAVRGRLFTVDGTMSVEEEQRPFDALGSGFEVARGALEAQIDGDDPIDDDLAETFAHNAVVAAIKHTNFVGGEVTSARTVRYTKDELSLAREMLRP